MTAASRRFFARLALIGVGAAAWRIWYVLGPVTDRVTRLTGDEFFYNWQARYFVEGRWFTNPFLLHNQHVSAPTALHPPLYTVFLAIPSALGFDTPTQSRLATALLGTGTVVLIGLLGRRIAGDRAGLVAALLAAAYPPLWSNDAVIGLETLYCFLVVLALIAVYRFWRTPSMWGAVAIAVPLALASLTRSEGIILFTLLGVPTALLVRSWDWGKRFRALGVMAVIGVLIIGPWVVRNLTTFEERTVLGTGFGLVLAYGNCDATYSGPMLGYWENRCLREYTPGVEESVFDKHALDQGSSYIEAHAGRLPVVMLARLGRIWEVYRPVQNVELNEFFEQRGHQASWATLIGYYLMLPFAIGGLVTLRRRRIPIYPFLAIVIAISITVVLGFPVTRYRASFDAVTPVLVAVALDALWRHWRRTRSGTGDTPAEPLDTPPAYEAGRGRGMTATTETSRTAPVDDVPDPGEPAPPVPSSLARSFGVWLAGAAGLGLVIRLMNVFWWRPTTDQPGYHGYRLWGDAFYYHYQANALADGKFFINPVKYVFDGVEVASAGHPPLYTIYLSLWSLVGIDSVTAHRVVSGLLGVATIIVVGLLGRRVAGAAVGLVAATIVAVYPFMWINDGMVMSESLAVLMAALVLAASYSFVKTPRPRQAILLGLACAGSALTRSEMLLLLPLLLVPLAFLARSRPWKQRIGLAVGGL